MNLYNLDFIRLIPDFMKNDATVIAFAEYLNQFSKSLADNFENLSIWNRIDLLPEEDLDELAWELNIQWYSKSAEIEVKRDLIKKSDLVHARKGTKWAVEQLVKSFFGSGRVEEWFDYGGQPFRFKVITNNTQISEALTSEFIFAVENSKNARSYLESVILELEGLTNIEISIGYHEIANETYIVEVN